eukprot:347842-Chlamydomonas_euryale.AAC.8
MVLHQGSVRCGWAGLGLRWAGGGAGDYPPCCPPPLLSRLSVTLALAGSLTNSIEPAFDLD